MLKSNQTASGNENELHFFMFKRSYESYFPSGEVLYRMTVCVFFKVYNQITCMFFGLNSCVDEHVSIDLVL